MPRVLRWVGRVALGLVLVAGAVYGYARIAVSRMRARQYVVPASQLVVSDDAATTERGRHLASSILGCPGCHGAHLAGFVRDDVPGFIKMGSPNITRGHGGVTAHYRTADWERAIRHGVRPDGTAIMFMPALPFSQLSDEDTVAVIAWARSMPPVDSPGETVEIRTGAMFPLAFGVLPFFDAAKIDHQHPHHPTPAADPISQGAYFIGIGGCRGCHGEHLAGGAIPGAPPSLPVPLNLTPHATGLASYTEADFVHAVRDGRRKNGNPIDRFMPWDFYAELTDAELHAMWAYLQTVPPRPFGDR